LSLARLPADAAFAVFEIGMNAPGEITPLVRLVRPHAAIVTTVVAAHAAYFASEEAIADAKAEIFLGLEPGGTAILNRDNRHFARLSAAALVDGVERIVGFGEADDADVRLTALRLEPEASVIEAAVIGTPLAYRLGAPGHHLAVNSLAVLAVAEAFGADLATVAAALAGFGAPAGRGERTALTVHGAAALLIDDAYNANPASMRAAFEVLALTPVRPPGRRIAVLGDMLELGDAAERLHADLAEPLAAAGVDVVHCAGPLMRALYESLPENRRGAYADAASGLESAMLSDVAAGDVVLVKGSKGSRISQIVASMKRRFATVGSRSGD